MPPISVMLKPSSSACNLRCKYCFYHSLSEKRISGNRGVMKENVLSDILKKTFSFANGNQVYISFQGGEPLLAGKKFFLSVFEFIEKYNTKNSNVMLAIQTNGTLIDDEWCRIFKEHNILVGVSLDGDERAHTARIFPDGTPSFNTVIHKIGMLVNYKVDYNILMVVNKQNAKRIEEIHEFFYNQGFKYIQYIPCLKPLGADSDDYALNGEEYGDFLIKAFKLYVRDYTSGHYTSVRLFDNFAFKAQGRRPEQCGLMGHCTHQYVIESDGETYPCDFFCTDEYSLGNILDTDFFALEKTPRAITFITESLKLNEKCKTCSLLPLCCGGGCKRERISMDVCTAYKKFLPYAYPIMKRMR